MSIISHSFRLVHNDLVKTLKHYPQGVDCMSRNISALLYADDIVWVAPVLQHRVHDWCATWGIYYDY